jgi:probable phosphoglycerate mutase
MPSHSGNLFDDLTPNPAPAHSPKSPLLTAHCDGGSRGNPGPAGFGAVIEDPNGKILARLNGFIGIRTNNVAEYSGLLAVLRWAVAEGHPRIKVVADSELMVKQMKGIYKVKSPDLRPLFDEARLLTKKLTEFRIEHTLRGGNKEADRLANEAMDKGMGKI